MSNLINRMKLIKLYSEPSIFEEVSFSDGLNLIVGEKGAGVDKQSQKNNSVGKSVCIDFIRFVLLKKYDETRIALIPDGVIDKTAYACLDLEIGGKAITIKRQISKNEEVKILVDNKESALNETQAKTYLEDLLYVDKKLIRPSFRTFLGSLMREETSNFKDIFAYYDTTNRYISRDFEMIIFFLDICLNQYKKTKANKERIFKLTEDIRESKRQIENRFGKKFNEIKSEIFNKRNELKELEGSLDKFKTDDFYRTIESEIARDENELDNLRYIRNKLKYDIAAIEDMPRKKTINNDDIKLVFNYFKDGLGDLISKSIEQTLEFKDRIDGFTAGIIRDELEKLRKDLENIQIKIDTVSEKLNANYNSLNIKGALKDLKAAYKVYENKKETLKAIENLYTKYEELDKKHQQEYISFAENKLVFSQSIKDSEKNIESFLLTITEIHERIMGTKESCSFDLIMKDTKDSREIVDNVYRIKDDGGHSVDREKVFIYDASLMFSNTTKDKHPQLLIHDNILEVDQDTIVQTLNFVYSKSKTQDFQYILTINKDRLEFEQEKLDFDIKIVTKKSLTKENKFLKANYQEKTKTIKNAENKKKNLEINTEE